MSAKAQLNELLVVLGKGSAYCSYAAIKAAVMEHGIALKDSSLKSYLTKAVDQKIIFAAGLGWYSRLSEPVVLDSKPLRALIRAIAKGWVVQGSTSSRHTSPGAGEVDPCFAFRR